MKKHFFLLMLVAVFSVGCSSSPTRSSDNNISAAIEYKNDKFGYTLKYPSGWNIFDQEKDKIKLSGITISPLGLDNLQSNADNLTMLNITTINLESSNSKYKDFNYYSKFLADQMSRGSKDIEINTIDNYQLKNNLKATKIEYKKGETVNISGSKFLTNGATILFDKNDTRFVFRYSYPTGQDQEYKKTFDGIVESIIFQ